MRAPSPAVAKKLVTQIAAAMLSMHDAFKLYHWSTASYSRHMATDELNAALLEHGDRFVESLIVAHGNVRPSIGAVQEQGNVIARLANLALPAATAAPAELDAWADAYVDACVAFWNGTSSDIVKRGIACDAALDSIAADLVGALRKAQYLFSFGKA